MAELGFDEFGNERRSQTAMVAVLAVVAAVVFTAMLYVIGATRASALATQERKIDDLNKQIAQFKDLESQARALSKGFTTFQSALAAQVDWRAFWNEIVSTQIRDVSYGTLAADVKNTVRVDGTAPSFVALSKQLKSLDQSALFSDVTLSQSAKTGDDIKFSITFTVDVAKLRVTK